MPSPLPLASRLIYSSANTILSIVYKYTREFINCPIRTAGRFNTIKIVPLVTFQGVIERCKQIEEGTFFSDAAG